MSIDPDILKASDALNALRQFLLGAIPKVDDVGLRGALQQAAAELEKGNQQLLREVPKLFADAQRQLADVQQGAAGVLERVAAMPPPVIPVAPAEATAELEPKDEALGPRLREEILERYAGGAAPLPDAVKPGMGFETWLSHAEVAAEPPPATKTGPTKPESSSKTNADTGHQSYGFGTWLTDSGEAEPPVSDSESK